MKKRFSLLVAVLLSAALLFGAYLPSRASAGGATVTTPAHVRNVIILVTDGTSMGGVTLTRWYNGGTTPLVRDEIATGMVRTFSADSLMTDSAPAATAIATGHLSDTGYIGVLPSKVVMPGLDQIPAELQKAPVANVLEGARMLGKSTGIIATSNIQHATPAAFSSHWADRNNYLELGEQQVYEDIDVVLGGGMQYLKPLGSGGTRKDGEDLTRVLTDRGYTLATTPAELAAARGPKLWGMFAPDAMAYDMDRDPGTQPSLAEMTSKAIDILSQNPRGFFLFVEGSKVDWAAHSNDPIGVISDTNAFDRAIATALDFAKQDGHTLVIATADHGNGGISIGSAGTNSGYDTTPYEKILGPLKQAKRTGEGLEALFNADKSNVREVMAEYYGITNLSDAEVAAIRAAKAGKMNATVGPMISQRANVGWTTTGHTGEDVPLYSYGPGRPMGTVHLSDLARNMAQNMGFDLDQLTRRLFVPALDVFQGNGFTAFVDNTDANNPVLVAEKGNVRAEFPISKDIVRINGAEHDLEGVSVYSNGRAWVSQDGIDLVLSAH